jgi:hypothetical protein
MLKLMVLLLLLLLLLTDRGTRTGHASDTRAQAHWVFNKTPYIMKCTDRLYSVTYVLSLSASEYPQARQASAQLRSIMNETVARRKQQPVRAMLRGGTFGYTLNQHSMLSMAFSSATIPLSRC